MPADGATTRGTGGGLGTRVLLPAQGAAAPCLVKHMWDVQGTGQVQPRAA